MLEAFLAYSAGTCCLVTVHPRQNMSPIETLGIFLYSSVSAATAPKLANKGSLNAKGLFCQSWGDFCSSKAVHRVHAVQIYRNVTSILV